MTPEIAALKPAPVQVFVVPPIPPPQRHPMIFGAFEKLAPGESVVLVNDHDPRPLHMQFQTRCAGRFEWLYLESGPSRWQVRILCTAAAPAGAAPAPALAGGCGGHGPAAPPAAPTVFRPADRAQYRPEKFNPLVLAQTPRMKVVLACFEPGQFIPVHSPGIDLALYVIEGRGTCQVGPEERAVQAGDLVWVPAGEKRGIRAETRMSVLHMVAPPPTDADHSEVHTGIARGTWKS
ncbi:MAG: DUF2249 domain-containing protein [Planctomycetota bacterium]